MDQFDSAVSISGYRNLRKAIENLQRCMINKGTCQGVYFMCVSVHIQELED